MSETTDHGTRPWHGAENPLEALYQHFTAEIEAVKARVFGPVPSEPTPSDPVPELTGFAAIDAKAIESDG